MSLMKHVKMGQGMLIDANIKFTVKASKTSPKDR